MAVTGRHNGQNGLFVRAVAVAECDLAPSRYSQQFVDRRSRVTRQFRNHNTAIFIPVLVCEYADPRAPANGQSGANVRRAAEVEGRSERTSMT